VSISAADTPVGTDAEAVRGAAQRAAAAAPGVRAAGGSAIDAALHTAAALIRDRVEDLLAANAADIAAPK
jgi:glutamate-5-semialdehyde dehydrogenase